MARYLVGISDNTWYFPEAVAAANPGDIIEFEKGYSLTHQEISYFHVKKI